MKSIITFHGTVNEIKEFNESSIGEGGDNNSALGVHSTTSPVYASEYADTLSTLTKKDGFIYVLNIKYNDDDSIESYDEFYGNEYEETDNKEYFKEIREDFLSNNIDLIFYDLEENITVTLNPKNIEIIDKLTIDQARKLGDLIDHTTYEKSNDFILNHIKSLKREQNNPDLIEGFINEKKKQNKSRKTLLLKIK